VSVRAIVFDFDGTIVESVDTKTQAFRTLFGGYPQHLERIVALHLEHGGRSRYEKFAMIYRDVLRKDPLPGEFDELGRRFESLVCDAVVACPFVPGARAFLEEYSARLPIAVVSGTPHRELIGILERRGLAPHFVEAHGSPPEKDQILRELLARREWPPRDVLFVGDARSDWLAAKAVGVRFVGRLAPGLPNPFDETVSVIPDLTGLDRLVEHGASP
jgi:phosphoglycolate phosphatase-like HAD superfamily hydrolase